MITDKKLEFFQGMDYGSGESFSCGIKIQAIEGIPENKAMLIAALPDGNFKVVDSANPEKVHSVKFEVYRKDGKLYVKPWHPITDTSVKQTDVGNCITKL